MKKSEEHNSARELFFQTDHSQAEIARRLGVDPKTVNLWVKHGKWQEIKLAARRTPAILVEQYFNQLAEMNNAIAARDEGQRFPSLKEAETMRKLIVCINSIQKQTSLGATIDVIQNLVNRIAPEDNDLANKVVDYADDLLKGPDINGIHSHEIAYDPDNSPLDGKMSRSFSGSGQGDVEAHDEQAAPQPLSFGETGERSLPPDEDRQSIGNEQAINEPVYAPKCVQDPNDPYTFYWHLITQRKAGSPKYGLPPEGFREVPKKDPLAKDYPKGFGRYNW